MGAQQDPRCRARAFLAVMTLARSCFAFAPSLFRPTTFDAIGSSLSIPYSRSSSGPDDTSLRQTSSRRTASWKATVALRAADDDDEYGGEELAGMAEFLEGKAERDRQMKEGPRGKPSQSSPSGLGLEGGIFPGDVFPASTKEDITRQGADVEPGQPEALVGFWQVRCATVEAANAVVRTLPGGGKVPHSVTRLFAQARLKDSCVGATNLWTNDFVGLAMVCALELVGPNMCL